MGQVRALPSFLDTKTEQLNTRQGLWPKNVEENMPGGAELGEAVGTGTPGGWQEWSKVGGVPRSAAPHPLPLQTAKWPECHPLR